MAHMSGLAKSGKVYIYILGGEPSVCEAAESM